MNPSDKVNPLSIFESEQGRAAVKAADVILGHDEAQGGKEVLFFGRALLERISAAGKAQALRIVHIAYDSRTNQLEYLAVAVRTLKGSCCYEADPNAPPAPEQMGLVPPGAAPQTTSRKEWFGTGQTKRIDASVLPDGTIEVRTPDEGQPHFAEARAREDSEVQVAIDALRAQGISRPVLFQLADAGKAAMETWRQLLPALRGRGIPTFSTGDDGFNYIVRPDIARELLRPLMGKDTNRLFRTASWPLSFYTVGIASDGHRIYESRTYKDQRRSEEGAGPTT